jgi:S-adenosylmethionine:tRNA ribosyltransferase-isomerase
MKNNKTPIALDQFDYELPDYAIAQEPPSQRGSSKLLVYKKGEIVHTTFGELTTWLPPKTNLIFNNTKVIPARLFFRKESGANIEIFLLEPLLPSAEMSQNLATLNGVTWKCMVGNAKKWKEDAELKGHIGEIEITAVWQSKSENHISFSWNKPVSFAELLELLGNMPLPPYIKRKSNTNDTSDYQTVYASRPGAVAAPTAGLHFTEAMLNKLTQLEMDITEVTLHVGAGTFQPIAVANVWDHHMHREFIEVSKSTLGSLCQFTDNIAVGTTSLRTLESLYWLGVQVQLGIFDFELKKEFSYDNPTEISFQKAMEYLLNYCNQNQLESITAYTELMIVPSYKIKSVHAIITNFHMPKSTLIMLVCAFIGDNWKKVYQSALENNYRFLSYGDSSLLFLED